MSFLQVRDWGHFQHYKDRNPPWIKMYTALLDDFEVAQLSDVTQLALMRIWLLAARQNNRLRNDPVWIQHRAGLREPPDLDALVAGGWLEPIGTPAIKSAGKAAPLTGASERDRDRKKERKPEASPEDELPEIAEMRERLYAQRAAEAIERGYLKLVEDDIQQAATL